VFYLSCKANSRVKLAKTGHGPHSSKMFVLFYVLFVFVSFCVLFVCKCVLYYCHRVATQLQLTNISYIFMVCTFITHGNKPTLDLFQITSLRHNSFIL